MLRADMERVTAQAEQIFGGASVSPARQYSNVVAHTHVRQLKPGSTTRAVNARLILQILDPTHKLLSNTCVFVPRTMLFCT